jgi:hypothetical protein
MQEIKMFFEQMSRRREKMTEPKMVCIWHKSQLLGDKYVLNFRRVCSLPLGILVSIAGDSLEKCDFEITWEVDSSNAQENGTCSHNGISFC